MASTNIKPVYSSEEEGNILRLVAILSIFFSFLPAILTFFIFNEKFTVENKKILAELTNFNILGIIILLVCLSVVLIGWLLAPVVVLFFISMNICFTAQIFKEVEVKIPIILPILKVK